MNNTRQIHAVLFVLVALFGALSMAVPVQAAASDLEFASIEIDDLIVDDGITVLDVQRGETITIEARIVADTTGADDVVLSARINGYEYGSIFDTTSQFDIVAGKTYKKTLSLTIPEDIDASEDYTLRIELSDKNTELTEEITLHIDEQRHGLSIFDVLLNPSSTIAAGNSLFATVRLENLGDKEENDVKVTVSIPDLGISTVNFIDELNTEVQEDAEDHIKNDNSQQIDLLLRIPSDAATGTYEVRVDVEYNRGYSFLSQSLNVNVQGTETSNAVQTIVNSDSNSKSVAPGATANYNVMLANLGEDIGVYSVQVDGVSAWGEASVQPSFLSITPDATGEVTISVTPFDGESTGTHTWVARVMVGTDVLQELTFTTRVTGEAEEASTSEGLKTVLAVIFGILVIVLVVLALIIAFRKINSTDDEETSTLEGQTYYQYYPK